MNGKGESVRNVCALAKNSAMANGKSSFYHDLLQNSISSQYQVGIIGGQLFNFAISWWTKLVLAKNALTNSNEIPRCEAGEMERGSSLVVFSTFNLRLQVHVIEGNTNYTIQYISTWSPSIACTFFSHDAKLTWHLDILPKRGIQAVLLYIIYIPIYIKQKKKLYTASDDGVVPLMGIYRTRQDPRCRLCKQHDETVQHISSSCTQLAGTAYT